MDKRASFSQVCMQWWMIIRRWEQTLLEKKRRKLEQCVPISSVLFYGEVNFPFIPSIISLVTKVRGKSILFSFQKEESEPNVTLVFLRQRLLFHLLLLTSFWFSFENRHSIKAFIKCLKPMLKEQVNLLLCLFPAWIGPVPFTSFYFFDSIGNCVPMRAVLGMRFSANESLIHWLNHRYNMRKWRFWK